MFAKLLDLIAPAYNATRHRNLLQAQWEQERWFDTPHQHRSARIARDALLAAGLADAQLVPCPADGRTRFQDWTVPLAWDCNEARLAFADSGDVLCDRRKVPTAAVFWSGPLGKPDQPAVAGVVDGDALKTITPAAVEGRYVLTAGRPRDMKARLVGMRPLAVVSDYIGRCPQHTDDTIKWSNTWGDNSPDGWYLYASDTVLPGFCISPGAGRRLRARLAAEPGVKLAGFCDARLYAGEMQIVTATLPGTDPSREIWLFGHGSECGASDNCSGTSASVEALVMLRELVAAGKLPQPRCSIRVIMMDECIGMATFATLRADLLRRALAGLYLDTVAEPLSATQPVTFKFGPWSNPSISWPVAGLIAEQLAQRDGGGYGVSPSTYVPCADDMIADPAVGVPCLWFGWGNPIGYHSSADTPQMGDPRNIRFHAILAATWAWQMASLDDDAGRALTAAAPAWIDRHVLCDEAGAPRTGDAAKLSQWVAGRILRDMGRWRVSQSIYEPTASRYLGPMAAPLPRLASKGLVYRRKVWGSCRLETIPEEQRKGLSCWSDSQAAGLYWTDGQRTLKAVERLTLAETGKLPAGGMRHVYEAAVKAGVAERV